MFQGKTQALVVFCKSSPGDSNVQPGLKSTLYQIYLLLKGLCITFKKKSLYCHFYCLNNLVGGLGPTHLQRKAPPASLEYHTWEGLPRSPGHLHCTQEIQKKKTSIVLIQGSGLPCLPPLDTVTSRSPPVPLLSSILSLPVSPHPLLSSGTKYYPKFSI